MRSENRDKRRRLSRRRDKAVVTGTSGTFKKAKGLLHSAGLAAAHFQTIEIKPVEFELRKKDHDWVIFTSGRGAALFLKKAGRSFFNGKKIAVMGSETGKAVVKLGLKTDFMPDIFDSRAFAAGFGKVLSGRAAKILLITPVKGGEELKMKLERAGASVDRVPVYATVPKLKTSGEVKKFMDGRPYSFVIFSSPSTFSGFIKILGKAAAAEVLSETRAAAIGRITAEKLRTAGVVPAIVPEKQTLAGIVSAIKEYKIKHRRRRAPAAGEAI